MVAAQKHHDSTSRCYAMNDLEGQWSLWEYWGFSKFHDPAQPCRLGALDLSIGALPETQTIYLLMAVPPSISFHGSLGGVPLVHHPGMHCAPDVNRAMRPGENLLDIQKGQVSRVVP